MCFVQIGTAYWKSMRAIALRLGFRYVRSLRETAAKAVIAERALETFRNIEDLTCRVPELKRDELQNLTPPAERCEARLRPVLPIPQGRGGRLLPSHITTGMEPENAQEVFTARKRVVSSSKAIPTLNWQTQHAGVVRSHVIRAPPVSAA
jgi:hypothetical protein